MEARKSGRLRRWGRWGLGVVLAAVLVNLAFSAFIPPMQEERLRQYAVELGGWPEEALVLRRSGWHSDVFSRSAYAEWEVDEGREVVYVEARRWLHVLPWRVVDYHTAGAGAE